MFNPHAKIIYDSIIYTYMISKIKELYLFMYNSCYFHVIVLINFTVYHIIIIQDKPDILVELLASKRFDWQITTNVKDTKQLSNRTQS